MQTKERSPCEKETSTNVVDSPEEFKAVDGQSFENRFYMRIFIAQKPYYALVGPGATISVVGPKLSDKFKERLTATDASVQRALELSTITLGKLRLWLNIDKVSQAFELRAVNTLTQDVIDLT